MKAAEPVAYRIGIHPDEFGNLQVREFNLMLEAYKVRQKDEDYKRSYFVSMIMRPHLQEPVSPDKIFNPLYYTKEEVEEMEGDQAAKDAEYFDSFKRPET